MGQESYRTPVVLVVENNCEVLEVLRNLVAEKGWKPITTANLKDAMLSFSTQPIDAIIADFELDDGNSLTLLKLASKCDAPRVPAVVISSYASEGLRDEVKRNGAVELLAKPFRLGALTERLEQELAAVRESMCLAVGTSAVH